MCWVGHAVETVDTDRPSRSHSPASRAEFLIEVSDPPTCQEKLITVEEWSSVSTNETDGGRPEKTVSQDSPLELPKEGKLWIDASEKIRSSERKASLDTSLGTEKSRSSLSASRSSLSDGSYFRRGWAGPRVSERTFSTFSTDSRAPSMSSTLSPASRVNFIGDEGIVDSEVTDAMDPNFRRLRAHMGNNSGTYEGQVHPERERVFHGHGRFEGQKWTYVGDWENGRMNGEGTQTWAEGHSYTGQFLNNVLNGHGSARWKHASGGMMVYIGEYRNDKKHGFGKFTWPSGRKYEGEWERGERHGVGVDSSAKGLEIRGKWHAGRLLYAMGKDDEPLDSIVQAIDSPCSPSTKSGKSWPPAASSAVATAA